MQKKIGYKIGDFFSIDIYKILRKIEKYSVLRRDSKIILLSNLIIFIILMKMGKFKTGYKPLEGSIRNCQISEYKYPL